MFTITSHKQRRLLLARLTGFFTIDEVGAFARAAQGTVQQRGWETGQWFHLCDVSALTLQSQAVTEAFSAFINHPTLRSRRLAIVTGQSTVRMQIRRLLERDDAALFDEREEAERWLFANEGFGARAIRPASVPCERTS